MATAITIPTTVTAAQAGFENFMEETGKRAVSTFMQDFAIADLFGASAIKDTYNRATAEWQTNVEMFTELCMVLNHQCWRHYDKDNEALCKLYKDLFYEAQEKFYEVYAEDEEALAYYYQMTD